MGQELPDNSVYAHINPGAARSVSSQGELKVALLTQVELLTEIYRRQTLNKKPAVELRIMASGWLSFCVVCNFYNKHCLFFFFSIRGNNKLIKIWDQFSLRTLRGSHVLPALL